MALTRAREHIYLIADRSHKSKSIRELEVATVDPSVKKCPRCKTADLVRRSGTKNGRPWSFWGCSNYPFRCDYTERIG